MCENNSVPDDDWIKGFWLSENSDTICVNDFLTINGSFPYDYNLISDSLIIFQAHSSDLNTYQSYHYETNESKSLLILYKFLQSEEITFSKQNKNCIK